MIECIECGYRGYPTPLTEAESTYGFTHVCPKCKGVNLSLIKPDTSLINQTNTPKVQPLILPPTI
jgi:phage FluMu protein Com